MSEDPEQVDDARRVDQDGDAAARSGDATAERAAGPEGDGADGAGDGVREQWETRSGEYSPEYYAHYGRDETSELVRDVVERHVDTDASVLELGCSVGRHLAHLREAGIEDLAGIDVNEDAADVMAEEYPELAASGTFHFDTFQSVLPELDDDSFDAVFSVQTLQHLPPEDEWVLDEVARVAGDLLLTVEAESPAPGAEPDEPGVNYVAEDIPLYYRNWEEAFAGRGFEQAEVHEDRRGTARVLLRE